MWKVSCNSCLELSPGLVVLGVLFIQLLNVGHSLLAKAALDNGMHASIYACYRNAIASIVLWAMVCLKKPAMPPLTFSVIWRVIVLAILEPVIDQMTFYAGLKSTNAGFSACMTGLGPALTFFLAVALRLEHIQLHARSTHLKLIGAAITIVGAGIMTIRSGPVISLSSSNATAANTAQKTENWLEGPGYIILAVASSALYTLLLRTFNPSSMILVILVSVLALGGTTRVGSIVGLFTVIFGLMVFLWGKSKESQSTEESQA